MDIKNIYNYYFYLFIIDKLELKQYDNLILNSNYLFGKSISIDNRLNLNFINCLNILDYDKISEENINILFSDVNDIEKIRVIENTYKDVMIYKDMKKITYGYVDEDRIIDNGTLVLEICYGKNTSKLTGEDYIENINNQRLFMEDIKKQLEDKINNILNINGRVLIAKIV